MKILIIAIGKKHEPKLAAMLDHYEKMLSATLNPEWLLLDAKHSATNSSELVKVNEGKALLEPIRSDDTVIVLDEFGAQISSPELASKIHGYQNNSVKRLVFVIGGAFGLDQAVKNRADFTWSLSKLVMPHQLVRLVVIEQLYRATTILAGKQYHY